MVNIGWISVMVKLLITIFSLSIAWLHVQPNDFKLDWFSLALIGIAIAPWALERLSSLKLGKDGIAAEFKKVNEKIEEVEDKTKIIDERVLDFTTPPRMSSIRDNIDFWKKLPKSIDTLMVVGLNGHRFIEQALNSCEQIKNAKFIFPSDDAIKLYYRNGSIVSDEDNAVDTLINSINETIEILKAKKDEHRISSYEVKRVDFFPNEFLCIVDGKKCLTGKYLRDPLGSDIGITSISWYVPSPNLSSHYSGYADQLWDSSDSNVK